MDSNEGCGYIVVLLLVFAVILGVGLWMSTINWITEEAAVARFATLAQVEESDIVVVRHSNNSLFLGNTQDVTFELLIKGEPTSGRCTSGVFSPMVCRLYSGGE